MELSVIGLTRPYPGTPQIISLTIVGERSFFIGYLALFVIAANTVRVPLPSLTILGVTISSLKVLLS